MWVLYWKIVAVQKVGEYDGMHLNYKNQQRELPILDRNIIFKWPIECRIFCKLSVEGKYPMIQGKGMQRLQVATSPGFDVADADGYRYRGRAGTGKVGPGLFLISCFIGFFVRSSQEIV